MNNYYNASIHSSKQSSNWWCQIPSSIKNTASVPNYYAQIVQKISGNQENQNYYRTMFIDEKLEFSDYEANIVGETALMKDWLLPQEDIAWKDL